MFPRRVQPVWQYQFDGSSALTRLGFVEGLSRSTLSVVVPLTVFDVMGSRQAVSVAYALAATFALLTTMSVSWLERRMSRRWITTIGIVSMATATALISSEVPLLLVVGLGLLSAGTSYFSLTLSLFIMESIGRTELRRSESTRVFYVGAAWLLGPVLGVWLHRSVDPSAPYLVAAALLAITLGYFWVLRLGSNPVLERPTGTAPNPLTALPRFFGQRYLRIAYAVTLVRAMFWVALFLFAPLYAVEAGFSETTGGLFMSLLAGLLLLSPVVGRLAETRSTRTTLLAAYGCLTAGLGGLALLGDPIKFGLAFWALAALGASVVDVLGNVPFMRTVRPRERVEMTAIFSTWRDAAALATPAVAIVLLTFGSMRLVYTALASFCLGTAVAASFLPRRI